MKTPRIEIITQVQTNVDSARVQRAGDGAATTITIAAGSYTCTEYVAALETALKAFDAAFSATVTAGVVTLAHSTKTVTWTWINVAVRDWLGFTATLSGAQTYTAAAQMPGYYASLNPWDDPEELALIWQTRQWRNPDRTGGGCTLLGSHRSWRTETLHAGAVDVAQWRSVLRYMLRGMPFRWWRDSAVNIAWSYTQWDGYLDAVLDAQTSDLSEDFEATELHHHLRMTLGLVEWAP